MPSQESRMPSAATAAHQMVPEPVGNPLSGVDGFLWTVRVCLYGFLLMAIFLGGPVLCLGAIAAAVLIPLADRSGAIRRAFQLVGLAVSLAAAPWLGIPLGAWAAMWLGVPPMIALLVAVVLTAAVFVFVAGRIGRRVTRATLRRRYAYVLNRVAGSPFGVAEGALVTVVFCWVLGLFGPTVNLYCAVLENKRPNVARLLGHVDTMREWVRTDSTGRWLERVNPLPHVPQCATVAIAAEMYAEPWLFWEAVDDGRLDEFLAIPVVRKHYERIKADPTVRHAVKVHDLKTILDSPYYAEALADDEFCKAVAAHWPQLRAKISDREIQKARKAAVEHLDPAARSKLERAVEKAEEYDIRLP